MYYEEEKSVLILTAMLLLSCISINAFATFDQAKAQRYADTYALSSNSLYRYWPDNDCTNFVSQCLYAGGMKECDDWYYNNALSQSATWIQANQLKEYLKNDVKATLLGRWKKTSGKNSYGTQYYAYVNNSNNIKGLGSEIIFYDWEDDGKMNHASIVVGTNEPKDDPNGPGVGDLIDAHTKARKWQYWHLDGHNKYKLSTAIYAYRLPSTI